MWTLSMHTVSQLEVVPWASVWTVGMVGVCSCVSGVLCYVHVYRRCLHSSSDGVVAWNRRVLVCSLDHCSRALLCCCKVVVVCVSRLGI